MKAVKTKLSNQVFKPPAGGDDWCDPVWVERTSMQVGAHSLPCVKLTYELEPNDLVHLNHGTRIELTIIGEGMPPVSMRIVAGAELRLVSASPAP